MGCGNSNPQKQQTSVQSQPQQSMAQQASSMPTGVDQSTMQYANNLKYLQQQGLLDTPYQKAMKQHPFLMGLSNAAQAFGQGLTKQPYYTANQENQASLQNTQTQGVMNAVSLPQQLKLMQAMYAQNLNPGGATQPTNVPGMTPTAPVISTPGGAQAPNPLAVQIAAAKAAGYNDNEIQAYLAGKK